MDYGSGRVLRRDFACGIYLQRSRRYIRSTRMVIDGYNLDSLNSANLRRRLNNSLMVQRAYHLGRIEGGT
jgi:hypothetical protein